jgi:hypothetical protein
MNTQIRDRGGEAVIGLENLRVQGVDDISGKLDRGYSFSKESQLNRGIIGKDLQNIDDVYEQSAKKLSESFKKIEEGIPEINVGKVVEGSKEAVEGLGGTWGTSLKQAFTVGANEVRDEARRSTQEVIENVINAPEVKIPSMESVGETVGKFVGGTSGDTVRDIKNTAKHVGDKIEEGQEALIEGFEKVTGIRSHNDDNAEHNSHHPSIAEKLSMQAEKAVEKTFEGADRPTDENTSSFSTSSKQGMESVDTIAEDVKDAARVAFSNQGERIFDIIGSKSHELKQKVEKDEEIIKDTVSASAKDNFSSLASEVAEDFKESNQEFIESMKQDTSNIIHKTVDAAKKIEHLVSSKIVEPLQELTNKAIESVQNVDDAIEEKLEEKTKAEVEMEEKLWNAMSKDFEDRMVKDYVGKKSETVKVFKEDFLGIGKDKKEVEDGKQGEKM